MDFNWQSMLIAGGILVGIAVLLGIILAFADKFLSVKEDPRKAEVLKNMPGANCGACGYPGCAGLVDAFIEGKVTKIRTCKVIKQEKAQEVITYLNATPGPNGETLKVTE